MTDLLHIYILYANQAHYIVKDYYISDIITAVLRLQLQDFFMRVKVVNNLNQKRRS